MTRFYQLALGGEVQAQQTLAGVKVNRLRAGETDETRIHSAGPGDRLRHRSHR